MGDKLKSVNGIALFSLMITVVVLGIIAMTTIGVTISDRGVLKSSKESKNTKLMQVEEKKENMNELIVEYDQEMQTDYEWPDLIDE